MAYDETWIIRTPYIPALRLQLNFFGFFEPFKHPSFSLSADVVFYGWGLRLGAEDGHFMAKRAGVRRGCRRRK